MLMKLLKRIRLFLFGRSLGAPEQPNKPDSPSIRNKDIFTERPDILALDGGYSAADLNEYIVNKTARWMKNASSWKASPPSAARAPISL